MVMMEADTKMVICNPLSSSTASRSPFPAGEGKGVDRMKMLINTHIKEKPKMGKDVIVACDFDSAEKVFAFLDLFEGLDRNPS